MGRYLALFLALAAVIAAPVLLKPDGSTRTRDFPPKDRLVVISPHIESIRAEFEAAFVQWMRERHGREVVIDWRIPGGTSEIKKVIEGEYRAALEHYWRTSRSDPWKEEYGREFMDASSQSPARGVWLESTVGIGIDVFFGGGPGDFTEMARKGCIVAGDAEAGLGLAALRRARPEWFSDAGIPEKFAGEHFRDPNDTWAGTCLSSFGICYNTDFYTRLGIKPLPSRWEDLASPALENRVAMADPGKSGTVVKMLENILQQEMQRAAAEAKQSGGDPKAALAEGWTRGLRIIQKIGANARYWTDSSTKIPLDVAEGDAAAGMCIDFYGRNIIERLEQANHGASRMAFVLPEGGTGQSVDPIAMLRGAPNPELATRFMEFVLGMEGQRLWAFKAGAPGGPKLMALRRLPVRRDYYTEENLRHAADPSILPYEIQNLLVYDPSLTGSSFSAIRLIIRAMCLDTHEELKTAWRALIANGFPPEATAVFEDVALVNYANTTGGINDKLKQRDPLVTAELSRTLAQHFADQYRRAARLAAEKR